MNYKMELNLSSAVLQNASGISFDEILGHEEGYITETLIALSIVGLLINAVTLIIMVKFCWNLNSHYLLVCNQCFTDTLICLFTVIERSLTYSEDFLANYSVLCIMMITAVIRLLAFVVSLLNMIVITLSRFLAVCQPTQYHSNFTRESTFRIVLSLYVAMCVLAAVTFLYIILVYAFNRADSFCMMFNSHGAIDIIDVTLVSLFTVLIIIMPLVYVYIAVVVVKKERDAISAGQRKERNKSNNIIMTSFWVVVTFIVCFAPYAVVRITMRFASHHFSKTGNDRLFILSRYLGLMPILNCILDPLIYAIRLPKIRNGYVTFCRNMKCS